MFPIDPFLLTLALLPPYSLSSGTGGADDVDSISFVEESAQREAIIRAADADPTLLAQRLAFLGFDRATHPYWLGEMGAREDEPGLLARAAAVTELAPYLQARLRIRAVAACQGVPFDPKIEEPGWATTVAVEAIYRNALTDNFALTPQDAGVPFGPAFLRFSAGELALPGVGPDFGPSGETHSAPNDSNHLLFTEAALLFVEEELHPDFWTKLVPTLVEGSERMIATHWDGTVRTLDSYGGGVRFAWDPAAHANEAVVATTAEERYRELLGHAFAHHEYDLSLAAASEKKGAQDRVWVDLSLGASTAEGDDLVPVAFPGHGESGSGFSWTQPRSVPFRSTVRRQQESLRDLAERLATQSSYPGALDAQASRQHIEWGPFWRFVGHRRVGPHWLGGASGPTDASRASFGQGLAVPFEPASTLGLPEGVSYWLILTARI